MCLLDDGVDHRLHIFLFHLLLLPLLNSYRAHLLNGHPATASAAVVKREFHGISYSLGCWWPPAVEVVPLPIFTHIFGHCQLRCRWATADESSERCLYSLKCGEDKNAKVLLLLNIPSPNLNRLNNFYTWPQHKPICSCMLICSRGIIITRKSQRFRLGGWWVLWLVVDGLLLIRI